MWKLKIFVVLAISIFIWLAWPPDAKYHPIGKVVDMSEVKHPDSFFVKRITAYTNKKYCTDSTPRETAYGTNIKDYKNITLIASNWLPKDAVIKILFEDNIYQICKVGDVARKWKYPWILDIFINNCPKTKLQKFGVKQAKVEILNVRYSLWDILLLKLKPKCWYLIAPVIHVLVNSLDFFGIHLK